MGDLADGLRKQAQHVTYLIDSLKRRGITTGLLGVRALMCESADLIESQAARIAELERVLRQDVRCASCDRYPPASELSCETCEDWP